MKAQIEAVTAGVVQQARSAGAPWARVAEALRLSTETARRVYHPERTTRLVERMAAQRRSALPAPAIIAYRSVAPEPAARPEHGDDFNSGDQHVAPLAPLTPPQEPIAPDDAQLRFVSALSLMQRRAAIPLRRLGQTTGVSASYVSRVLAGSRFPSRQTTFRLAQECGAAVDEIMALWEQAQHARTGLL
ncbi:helix-turn-helix transcriptional regulator [Streptomyces diastatochromogenes]|uniref:helix-turn-helix domain-containing protein n=1 Tax=Streptomyces diastatochromogenes TaxID=42236 RepID=UPI002F26772C